MDSSRSLAPPVSSSPHKLPRPRRCQELHPSMEVPQTVIVLAEEPTAAYRAPPLSGQSPPSPCRKHAESTSAAPALLPGTVAVAISYVACLRARTAAPWTSATSSFPAPQTMSPR
ncbi:hypothetical protein ZWY2020_005953 [Hordeum vulgare]|nr:hypothetical protein ZWY2020_005953 [Hordeum vulgare]